MSHLEYIFEGLEPDKKEIVIALLANEGFNGFDETVSALKAYIPEREHNGEATSALLHSMGVSWIINNIQETNWNSIWESGFKPVLVTDPVSSENYAYLRASFHPAIGNVKHDIIITPKMSFGTGHHATTYLIVSEMSLIDIENRSVIDFGTGTGVLAVIAEKEKAKEIIAVDNDDWSITNAAENFKANKCTKITLIKADTLNVGKTVDIILANINRHVILSSLKTIHDHCHSTTIVLFSGLLTADEPMMIDELDKAGFKIDSIKNKDNWMMIKVTLAHKPI